MDVYVQEPSSSRDPDDFDGIKEDVKEEDCECYFEGNGCDDTDLFDDLDEELGDDCERLTCSSWGLGRLSRFSAGSSDSSSSSSSDSSSGSSGSSR